MMETDALLQPRNGSSVNRFAVSLATVSVMRYIWVEHCNLLYSPLKDDSPNLALPMLRHYLIIKFHNNFQFFRNIEHHNFNPHRDRSFRLPLQ